MSTATLGEELDKGGTVFLAGAGVSIESGIPSVPAILSRTAKLFLPETALKVGPTQEMLYGRKGRSRLQPELFYECILSTYETTDCLALWSCLSRSFLDDNCPSIQPNETHLSITQYSHKAHVPIITTNFDPMFEMAAEKLGIAYRVVLPGSKGEAELIRDINEVGQVSGSLVIYKVHGCASQISSLATTMTSITAINPWLAQVLAKLGKRLSLTLCGYSGSDIDIFPLLCRTWSDKLVTWFNPFNDIEKHRLQILKAREVHMLPSTFFAGRTLRMPHAAPTGLIDEVGDAMDAMVGTLDLRLKPEKFEKALVLVMSLRAFGRNKSAESILQTEILSSYEMLGTNDKLKASVAAARIYDGLGKYETGLSVCNAAIGLLKKEHIGASEKLAQLHAVLLSRKSNIRKQMIGPLMRYGNPALDWRPKTLSAITALLLLVVNLFNVHRVLRRSAFRRDSVASIEAWQSALDSEILLMAGMDAAAMGILRRLGFARLVPFKGWKMSIYRRAVDRGDFFAQAGVAKYGVGGGELPEAEAKYLYDTTSDPLNLSLLLRNEGIGHLRAGDTLAAQGSFLAAYKFGIRSGSGPTQIKALVGLVASGADKSLLLKRIPAFRLEIEGYGYVRYFDKLSKTLMVV